MDRKLFTQDGKEYVIKTASNHIYIAPAANLALYKRVYVNYPVIPEPIAVHISPNKNIIPIAFNISVVDSFNNVLVDVSNCFYYVRSGPTLEILIDYIKPMGKMFPYVQRVYYTSANYNNFVIDYNKLIFHSSDFISIADNFRIFFTDSLAYAMCTQGNIAFAVLPAGDYSVSTSFTYFELK